jgi:hypothetical protein
VPEVDDGEEERGGKAPYRDPSAAAFHFDGEGAELREGGGAKHLGRPGDPDTAVSLDLEAGTAARREQQQGGQLGLPGVPNQRGQVVDVRGGGDPSRARHPKDDGVVGDHPEERGGGAAHPDPAEDDPHNDDPVGQPRGHPAAHDQSQ